MRIQLLPEDINGHHSSLHCPFHSAIQRACPKLTFAVQPEVLLIQDAGDPISLPAKMTSWIICYDNNNEWDQGDDIKWGLNHLIEVDLPLEEYCA